MGQLATNVGVVPEVSSEKVYNKKEPLTVKIELHRVDPYKIMWVGEKKFFRKGQEETFVRFKIDKEGEQIGAFSYEEKKFVTPFDNRVGMVAPAHEPTGSPYINSGTEESHYSERDTGTVSEEYDGVGGF